MGIVFSHGLQQGPVLESFKKIVEEWNVGHPPHSQVCLKNYSDYGQPVRDAFICPEEEQPNLVLSPEYMTGTMMKAFSEKKVIPINTLLSDEGFGKIAEIVRRTFGDKEGNLYSLPFNPACGVLYANIDLLKQIDKGVEDLPKTMEELEKICRLLIEKNLIEAGYTCAWPAAYLAEIPAAQQNVSLIEPDNGREGYGTYRFSQDWLVSHLKDIRRQVKENIFIYAGRDNNSKKPFVDRKVVFFMQGSTHYASLQQEVNATATPFTIGCAPLPKHSSDSKYAFPLGGAAIWVLNNDKTQKMIEDVRAFLNYLSSEEIQERWHKETGYVPVLSTLPKKLEDFYKNHPLHRAVIQQTIEATMGEYCLGLHASNYDEARKELFAVIEKVIDPATSDEEAETLLQKFDEQYSLEFAKQETKGKI